MATKKAFTPGHFQLEVDGKSYAMIKSCELPGIEGDVAEYQLATDNFASKAITNFKYSAAKLEISLAQGKELWTWLESAINKESRFAQAALILADADLNAMNRVDMEDVYITELGFPAFDASAKELASISVSLRPTRVRFSDASGKIQGNAGTGKLKNYATNNFELQLGSFDPGKVKKVDAFKFENKVTENWLGKFNEPDLIHTKLTRGDLTVEWTGDYAMELQKYADSMFRGGARGKGSEIDGSLSFLKADMTAIGGIEFMGCSLKSLKMAKLEGGGEKAATCTTVFTVETAKITDFDADT
jgi:phage tail-like protein